MIIIPDVHGRPFWIQAARDLGGKEHFVFLGDYLDPYGYEGITPEMAFDIFQEVLDFKEAWPDKVTLLLGNHDLHYLDSRLEGGRYDSVRGMFIRELILDHADWFRMAFETEAGGKKFLLTHAGVLRGWCLYNRDVLGTEAPDEIAPRLNEMWADETLRRSLLGILAQVPYSRWGRHRYGSPVWNDVEDMNDNCEELPGVYQIFGHSQQEFRPVICDHFACLDVRAPFRLTGEGEIVKLENTDGDL